MEVKKENKEYMYILGYMADVRPAWGTKVPEDGTRVLELELKAVVSHLTWVLGTKL